MPLYHPNNIQFTYSSSANIAWPNIWPTITYVPDWAIVPGNQPQNREAMSTPITTSEQLFDVRAGERVIVRQVGNDQSVKIWTALGGGMFRPSDEETEIPVSAFIQAITNGNVFLPGDHRVGEVFNRGRFYYKIVDQQGDQWVIAKVNGHAADISWYIGYPLDLGRREDLEGNDALEKGFATALSLYQAEEVKARLERILETGRIPVDAEYKVTVEVTGNAAIQPSDAQAKRLVGDAGITILNVNTTDVSYFKIIEVTKTARWGCGCDLVCTDDLADSYPGDLGSWRVLGCEPTAPNAVSEVHTA